MLCERCAQGAPFLGIFTCKNRVRMRCWKCLNRTSCSDMRKQTNPLLSECVPISFSSCIRRDIFIYVANETAHLKWRIYKHIKWFSVINHRDKHIQIRHSYYTVNDILPVVSFHIAMCVACSCLSCISANSVNKEVLWKCGHKISTPLGNWEFAFIYKMVEWIFFLVLE